MQAAIWRAMISAKSPCYEKNCKKITQERVCSDADKPEAEAIRLRCSGAQKKAKPDDKEFCGKGTLKPTTTGGVEYRHGPNPPTLTHHIILASPEDVELLRARRWRVFPTRPRCTGRRKFSLSAD